MRLHSGEALVAAFVDVGDRFGNAALALAGNRAVLRPLLPVLDMEVDDPVARFEPTFHRIVAAENEVRGIIGGADNIRSERLPQMTQQIGDALGRVAINAMLIFMYDAHALLARAGAQLRHAT